MRRIAYVLAAVALVAVVVIGLAQAGGDEGAPASKPRSFDVEQAQAELRGAPAPLAALHEQSNRLLKGDAFTAALDSVRGHPAVINKWASWCAPCQAEFGVFESVGTERGKEVAFLGVNGTDKDPAARKFLAKRPLPFPSYTDGKSQIAYSREIAAGFPMTQFITRDGKTFTHTGPYTSEAQLTEDIERYFR
jgi:cytochrome c biogenesis protein CcmG/thiol:disulfide interchange protein DsbE